MFQNFRFNNFSKKPKKTIDSFPKKTFAKFEYSARLNIHLDLEITGQKPLQQMGIFYI